MRVRESVCVNTGAMCTCVFVCPSVCIYWFEVGEGLHVNKRSLMDKVNNGAAVLHGN